MASNRFDGNVRTTIVKEWQNMSSKGWRQKLGMQLAQVLLPLVLESLVELLEELLKTDLDGDGNVGKE